MSKGYASSFIDEVNASDKSKLGVRLGIICIKQGIPVTDVCEFFGVSRTAVYAWFLGKSSVSEKHSDKMEKLVQKLR